MIVFLAGVNGDETIIEGLEAPHVLESFHYRRNVEKALARGWRLFLDSGAFSAYTVGAEINLPDYMAFIREHEEKLVCYAALDDLKDPAVSVKNYQTMLDAGLKPTLVYHSGDPSFVMDFVCATDCPLAVGGVAQLRTPGRLRTFFTSTWTVLQRQAPGRRVHGFGVTSFEMMRRFPWTSVDSTVWVKASAYGKILHPGTGEQIFVDEKSPYGKEFDKHYDSMSNMSRAVLESIAEERGFTMAELRTNGRRRAAFNARVVHEYGARLRNVAFEPQGGLFDA